MPPETIDNTCLEAYVAAYQKWLTTTPAGAAHALALLQLQAFRGADDKTYYLVDERGCVEDQPRPEDVWMLQGLVVSGRFIPPVGLRVSEKDRSECSSCGILTSCLKNVRDPHDDRLKSLCNYCISHSESPRIRDEGNLSICESCTVTSCGHHPARALRRVYASR